jgi:hypothetical protein
MFPVSATSFSETLSSLIDFSMRLNSRLEQKLFAAVILQSVLPGPYADRYLLLLFRPQRKFAWREAAGIPQHEEETPQAIVTFRAVVLVPSFPVPHARLPLHRGEAAANTPACVRYQYYSVPASVAAAMEFWSVEAGTAVSPQQIETLGAEFCTQRPKFPDDQRINLGSGWRRRLAQPIGSGPLETFYGTTQRELFEKSCDCCRAQKSNPMWRRRAGSASRTGRSAFALSTTNDSLESRSSSASMDNSKRFQTDWKPTPERPAKAAENVRAVSPVESSERPKKSRPRSTLQSYQLSGMSDF